MEPEKEKGVSKWQYRQNARCAEKRGHGSSWRSQIRGSVSERRQSVPFFSDLLGCWEGRLASERSRAPAGDAVFSMNMTSKDNVNLNNEKGNDQVYR